jgi:hypothetical protein
MPLPDVLHDTRVVRVLGSQRQGRIALGRRQGKLPQMSPEDESRHGGQRLESQPEGAPRVSRAAPLDDACHAGERIEPDRQLGSLEADDELGPLLDTFIGEEQHSLRRKINRPIADQTPRIRMADAATKPGAAAHLMSAIGRQVPAGGASEGRCEQAK